jgi:hypothetical protein
MMDHTETHFEGPVPRSVEVILGAALIVVGSLGIFVGVSWAVFDNPRRLWTLIEGGAGIGGVGVIAMVLGARLLLHWRRTQDGGLMSPTALRVSGFALLVGSALPLTRGAIGILHVVAMWGAVVACFALAQRRESLPKEPCEAAPNVRFAGEVCGNDFLRIIEWAVLVAAGVSVLLLHSMRWAYGGDPPVFVPVAQVQWWIRGVVLLGVVALAVLTTWGFAQLAWKRAAGLSDGTE